MINRRRFLKILTQTVVWTGAHLPILTGAHSGPPFRVALLHLAPRPGKVAENRQLVERAVTLAAANKAHWIVTPELSTSGYGFRYEIGTDWIRSWPDPWMQGMCRKAADLGITLFLCGPEKDPKTAKLHNTVFVIGPDGSLLGKHRKVKTIRVGSEAWSSPGQTILPIHVPPVGKTGILVCADAYPAWIAGELKAKGAGLLISPANWCKGLHGPSGEWERCSRDTGLTLLVCNRTGRDRTLDFRDAESAVISNGQRRHTLVSETSAVFLVDLDPENMAPGPDPPVKIPVRE